MKISTNTAPTASAGTVMATEDTAYAFAAANFNFSDADTSDTLSAVSIETLPALGTLALSGTAVSAGDSINSTDLGAGNLTYTPPADGYGDALASFTFKVNDGTVDSADSYAMTINVMNVNDDPTGAPAIMGDPVAGTTLTLDLSGIMDADGLPDNAADFEITWYHTDNLNDDIGFGPTLQLITSRDIGKNLQVVVGFDDDGGGKEEVVLDSWPATGTIISNTAPTASAGTVMATEDTAYAFAAANFNFSDANTSDTLSAVSIETLPAIGTLALSGTAVSAMDEIDRTDLDAGNLTYTPPADGYGDALASFTFKVSDGTDDSADSYAMTINVMNVNDDPTGAPAIVGEPVAGATLTLDLSGIMDADGLPDDPGDFEIGWYHTDNLNNELGNGATTLDLITSRDIGKNLQVVVGFDDNGGGKEEVVLDSWPATGAIVPALTVEVVSGGSDFVVEGGSATVGVELSGAPGREVTITMAVSGGNAASPSDYTVSPLALTFGLSEMRKDVTVTATDDMDVDPNEVVWLSIDAASLPSGVTVEGGRLGVTIVDNDFDYDVSLVGGAALTVDEAAGTLTATVRVQSPDDFFLSDLTPLNETVTLMASTADGTATAGEDYTALSTTTLTFALSDFSEIANCVGRLTCVRAEMTVAVPITDDMVSEGTAPETFTLTLSHGSGQRVAYPSGATVTVSITDDDVPELTFEVAPTTIRENGGTATVTIATSDNTAVTADVTVALTLAGTATEGTDYSIASKSLTLASGDSSVNTTITATADSASDDNETVLITASSGGDAIGSQQTVTIEDALTVMVTNPLTGLVEGGSITVPVELDWAPGREVTIPVLLEPRRGATVDDFTVAGFTDTPASVNLTFGADETRKEITLTATDDSVVDLGEVIYVDIDDSNLPAGVTRTGVRGTFVIVDNDFNYDVSLAEGAAVAVDEGAGTLTTTVRVQLPIGFAPIDLPFLNESVVVTISSTDGTATAGEDYTALSARTLTFTSSDFSEIANCVGNRTCARAEMTVAVPITDDMVSEGTAPETFTLTLSHGAGQRVAYPSGAAATVSITDNDVPVLTLSALPPSILEGGGMATVTVSTGAGPTFSSDQTITLSLAGTATKGTDYSIASESLTLTAGETSATTTITATADILSDGDETILISATHNSVTIGTQQTVTITEAAPTLSVAVSQDSIAEAAGSSTLTVSSTSAFSTDQTISLALAGTATKGDDYTISPESLTLTAGQISVTATVTAVQDTIDDDDETVLITATHNTTTIGAQQTVTITDDDAAPTLSVSVNNAAIAEAAGSSTLTVSTGATTFASDQTISLTLAGTATKTADYTISAESLTLTAGQTSVMATVTAVQDVIDEPNETVLITATHNSVAIGTQQTVTITDDDAPTLSLAVGPATIPEAAGSSTVTVSTGGSTFSTDQTITLTLAGTATKGDDYTISAESLTLTAGQTSVTATITAVADMASDDNETILITATHNSVTIGTQQTVTITETLPTFSISLSADTIAEAAGASTLTVTSTSTFAGDQTISLALAGTATQTADYTISAESLTLTAGQTSVTATVTAVQDTIDEVDETVLISATHNSASIGSATVTITDDDAAPTLSVAVSADTIAEAAGSSTLTVSTGGTTFATDQTITLTLAGTATKTADYTISAESLTLTAGQASVMATVTAVQDIIDEVDETVLITATHNSVTIGTQQTVTITDDDAPMLSVAVSADTIAEAAGASTVTVSTGGTTFSTDQTITLTLAGTATKGDDYTISAESLTLTAGETSVMATVTAVQDTTDEVDETVLITATHNMVTIGAQQTVTITDDDDAPTLSVAVSPDMIAEAAGSSTVTVSTGGTTFTTDQVIALTLAGTATKTADYTISAESLTLTAGQTSVTATVTAVQDTIDDDDETVLITATHNATTIGTQQTVTITDDDAAPVLEFTLSSGSVAEAAGTTTVTVGTGTGSTFATDQAITLTLGGTATEGGDFGIGPRSLTLAAGTGTSASSITTTITAVQDKIDESNETILIDATRATGGSTVAVGSQLTVTITDDDAAPVLEFTLSSGSVAEASGASTVMVGTGTGSTFETEQTITLTLGGTATENDDYTIASKSLLLPAGAGTGASSVETDITAVQDTIDEPDETALITATHSSATIGTQQTVTIADDDAAPVLSLSVSSTAIAEAAGASTVTVGTGTGSTFETEQTITLTLGGTATVNDDYTIGSTTLTLPAGAGSAVSEITTEITAVDDDFFEGVTQEQLTVAGSLGGTDFGATRTVTILENEDAPKLTLSLSDNSISEDGGSTTVTASVAPRTVDAFTVTFAVTPGAPATAADYDLTGTLSFAALSASPTGTVTITTNDNRVDRPDKTVSVTGTSSQTYFRATDAVTLTIEDEDAAPAPVLEVSAASIAENGGESTVTVTTSDGSTFPDAMTVTLTMTGAAGENADYTIGSKSLTLPAGSGLGISMISTTVTGIDDIIDDDAEDILIDAVIGGSAVGTQQTVTIDDDDAAPVLEISVSAASVAENGGTSTVTVTTGTGSTFVTEQAIALSLSGTATLASDYSVDTTLTLPAGVGLSASSVEVTLTGVDDRIDDDAETVLIDAAREGSGFGTQQTVTIDDDDAAPVLVFTAQPANIGENGGVSTLTVGTGTGSTYATEQSITLAVVEGTAIEGADYTIASRSLTLPAGVGSSASSADTTVTGLDDGVFEGDEDQTVLVSATHAGAPVGTAQVAVVDDEANSQVVLTLSPDSIAELDNRDTSVREHISQITASVSPPAEHAFVVDLEITPNAPATTADFTEALPVPSLGLLDFAAGATQSTGNAFINAVDNEVDTPDKTLTVSGSISGFDYDGFTVEPAATTGILAPAPQALTIRDDDEAADTVSLSLDATSVAESAGATPIEATATLASGARESAVTVTLTVGSGTGDAGAESGIDFEEVAAFTITIPAGSASATADFSLTPVDDRIDEADEVLSVTGATDDVLIGVPEAAEITITDNDDAPELTLEVQPATIAENGGTATVTVSTGTGSTFAVEQRWTPIVGQLGSRFKVESAVHFHAARFIS